MKHLHYLALACATIFTLSTKALAADTLHIKMQQVPLMVERIDNPIALMRINATKSETMESITLKMSNINDIKSIKLYYGGLEGVGIYDRFAPISYIERSGPRNLKSANPHFSVLQSKIDNIKSDEITLPCAQKLSIGVHYFWISVELKPAVDLSSTFNFSVTCATVDGSPIQTKTYGNVCDMRVGVGVRYAGDDGIDSYRIPGLVTTNAGSLIGIYDVRHDNSVDLQGKVDVGVSRSTDGGVTWDKMRIALNMGTYGGLPMGQNGVGDAAVLVDKVTGDILIIGAWSHGMGYHRMWTHSRPGMEPLQTAQLVISRSTDDGRTWSAPVNITPQVKQPSQRLFFQGPGRGITMKDGTLVFAAQYIDSTNMPYSTIIYSTDHGTTWHTNAGPRANTTESQVVEIEPGVLMLNMRDNRGESRAIAITRDMGATWSDHISNRSVLQEPVCMASLIAVDGKDNAMGKDIVLFSNPNTTDGRYNITIKGSLDAGKSFPVEYQILLDDGQSWGYSCLTMVDSETVGILYEGSTAHMVFQSVKLKDIFK